MREYPAIELALDFTARQVDVIEEGFDAVIRTGSPADSRQRSSPWSISCALMYFHLLKPGRQPGAIATKKPADKRGFLSEDYQLTGFSCMP